MNNLTLNGKRIAAFLIDMIVISTLADVVIYLTVLQGQHGLWGLIAWVFSFVYLLCRDSYNGISYGRKLVKIRVVSETTNEVPSPLTGVLRNLPLVILGWLEIILVLNNKKRLGDIISRTKIVDWEGEVPKESLVGAVITYAVVFALLFSLTVYVIQTCENIPFRDVLLMP